MLSHFGREPFSGSLEFQRITYTGRLKFPRIPTLGHQVSGMWSSRKLRWQLRKRAWRSELLPVL